MLSVESDQVHVVNCLSSGFSVFKGKFKVGDVLVSLEGERIIITGQFEDLREVCDVDTEGLGGVSSKLLESVGWDVERNESNVGAVHSLNGKTLG